MFLQRGKNFCLECICCFIEQKEIDNYIEKYRYNYNQYRRKELLDATNLKLRLKEKYRGGGAENEIGFNLKKW